MGEDGEGGESEAVVEVAKRGVVAGQGTNGGGEGEEKG